MKVYRLTAEKFKDDLSGKGAAIYGGRWNPISLAMLYTSESRALANLEMLVHITPGVVPLRYYILKIEIPEMVPLYEITEKQLPKDTGVRWNTLPSLSAITRSSTKSIWG